MSTGPLIFSNSLLGLPVEHWITYGLFFVAGLFDLLGGYLPSLAIIDLGVTASAWLGGVMGMIISGGMYSSSYLMGPLIPAIVAGVLTAVLCGMVGIQYCRALALLGGILFWYMQSGRALSIGKAA